MSPTKQATAFKIWQYAEPLGWDVTIQQIAENLDKTDRQIRDVCKAKGWLGRINKPKRSAPPLTPSDFAGGGLQDLSDLTFYDSRG